MSIVGIGGDIVAVGRIEDLILRYGDRFLNRCYRPAEVEYIKKRGRGRGASAAARWAAKEAFLKALGQNVDTIPYRDIEVVREASGPVKLLLHGVAQKVARDLGINQTHLALSHEIEYATATVILENLPS